MRRYQVFSPEDLDLMTKVFLRARMGMQGEQQKTQLAKAIVMTFRPKASEAALAAAAVHLVGLKYLN